jgi:hypothetical protein
MKFSEVMKQLVESGIYVYIYCTDFIINLANLFNLSYYEVNFVIFCLLYPLALISSFLIYIRIVVRFRKKKKQII